MEKWNNGKSRTTTVSRLRILESIFEDFSMNVFNGSKFLIEKKKPHIPSFQNSIIPIVSEVNYVRGWAASIKKKENLEDPGKER
jgi:hypothetical protein